MKDSSTVAAISTPYGRGGIAVIRISGESAVPIAENMFSPKSKKLSEYKARTAVFGDILYDGEAIDTGIATVFRAPYSFTGEDTVEISCHGGILLTQKVLESVFNSGAAPAGSGEFTKRAFLNGKLGLSQAEAVIELIDAESEEKIRLASAQCTGALSALSDKFYNELKELVAGTYVYIDYPDEDLTDIGAPELKERLVALKDKIGRLLLTYKSGKAINEGINTVILGKPNTGKSSVLNALLGEDRAIVTDIAGTTRDTVEEKAVIGKIILNLCDTAGLRDDTDDVIEKIGIERSKNKAESADLIIAVFDGSAKFDAEDASFLLLLNEYRGKAPIICLLNKSDCEILPECRDKLSDFTEVIEISAKSGAGLESLKNRIERLFVDGNINYRETAVIANARQNSAFRSAFEHIDSAVSALDAGFTQDIACLDLEQAMSDLSELDGRGVSEDLVNSIFHRFCVGK